MTADVLTWVVFDPVATHGLLFVQGTDRADDGTVTEVLFEKAIIGCATEEAAREVLYKMFGRGDGWTDGRFIIRSGTPEQLEKLMQDVDCRDVYDGEKVIRR